MGRISQLVLGSLILAAASESAAQPHTGRLAVDHCYSVFHPEGGYAAQCDVGVIQPNGYSYWESGGSHPALSPDGRRLAFFGSVVAEYFVWGNVSVVNLDTGSRSVILSDASAVWSLAWSHDGRLAFLSNWSGTWDLYVMNADGTGLRQLTSSLVIGSAPSWSPDGRIVFTCEVDTGNSDICSIRPDGTAFTRMTNSADIDERGPIVSPDGTRIAFVGSGPGCHILNADGTVEAVGPGCGTWSPDGTRFAFHVPWSGGCDADGRMCGYAYVYSINIDGTDRTLVADGGGNPSWALAPGSLPPIAFFTASCRGLVCTFDASFSRADGPMARFDWQFGDGRTGSGATPVHEYASAGRYDVGLTVRDEHGQTDTFALTVDVRELTTPLAAFTFQCTGVQCQFTGNGSHDADGIAQYLWDFGDGTTGEFWLVNHRYVPGTYIVTLTVVDNTGLSATKSTEITVANRPPVASIQFSCDAVSCTFSAIGSSDVDGTIVSYAWQFADGTQASGFTVLHTFATSGSYSVALTVTDDLGTTATATASVSVVQRFIHIGDLDGITTVFKQSWMAGVAIAVHDAEHRPVSTGMVSGVWSDGRSSICEVVYDVCSIPAVSLPNSVRTITFTVTSVTAGGATYDPARSHDVDLGTNGMSITITKR